MDAPLSFNTQQVSGTWSSLKIIQQFTSKQDIHTSYTGVVYNIIVTFRFVLSVKSLLLALYLYDSSFDIRIHIHLY